MVELYIDAPFDLSFTLKRVGTAGDAIAELSFTDDGGANFHDCIWIRLIDPQVNVQYRVDLTGFTFNDSKDVNPIITQLGMYEGRGVAWNGSSSAWSYIVVLPSSIIL